MDDPRSHPIFRLLILLAVQAAAAAYMWYTWVRPGLGRAHWSWYVIPGLTFAATLTFTVLGLWRMFASPSSDLLIHQAAKRPPSFSVILLHGDMTEALIEWIPSLGLEIRGRQPRFGPYSEVVGSLLASSRALSSNAQWWAVFQANAHTVLVDWPFQATSPTQEAFQWLQTSADVMFAGNLRFADEPWTRFCEENSTVATIATWDQISTLVLLRDIDRTGLMTETLLVKGQQVTRDTEDPDNAPPVDSTLVGDPSYDGLMRALARRGIDTEAILGPIQAVALEIVMPQPS